MAVEARRPDYYRGKTSKESNEGYMTYPKTMYWADRWGDIKPVMVLRETDKQVVCEVSGWMGETVERREAKESQWKTLFGTWEDAKAFIVARQEQKVKSLRAQLESENGRLGQLRGMKNPDSPPL